eukprot:scaffold3118_cov264-Pinguiococcus_pyrenoidosus.AAC.7
MVMPQDVRMAMEEYRDAADRNSPSGCYNLGFLLCKSAIDSLSIVKAGPLPDPKTSSGRIHFNSTAAAIKEAKSDVHEGGWVQRKKLGHRDVASKDRAGPHGWFRASSPGIRYLTLANALGVKEAGYQLGQLYASGLSLGLLDRYDDALPRLVSDPFSTPALSCDSGARDGLTFLDAPLLA